MEPGPDRGGSALVGARCRRGASAYTLQAAIAAVHAEAPSAAATDWAQIVGLYDRAAARGPVAGGRAEPRGRRGDARWTGGRSRADRRHPRTGELHDYHFAHSARADLCRRLGEQMTRGPLMNGPRLTRQEPERRFSERRLAELKYNVTSLCRFRPPRTTIECRQQFTINDKT